MAVRRLPGRGELVVFADTQRTGSNAYCKQRMGLLAIQHAWRVELQSLAQEFSLSFW